MFYHRLSSSLLSPVWFFLLVVSPALPASSAGPGDDLIKKVQEKFQSLKSLSVRFDMRTQSTDSSMLGALGSAEGRLFLGDSGRFRMEGSEQTIVCDGQTMWIYHPQGKQVILYQALENQNPLLTPRQLLFDYARNYKVEKISDEKVNNRSCRVLDMVPEDPSDPTRCVKVWVDSKDYLTRRFLIEDLIGNVIIFDFEDFKIGQNLPDSIFKFTPPAGTEVVDMR